jgi:hypothetical protein
MTEMDPPPKEAPKVTASFLPVLQNSYIVNLQSSQNAPERNRYKLPRKQCYFTEEQVYAAMLKHEGARSKVAKELDCHVRTVDEYIKRFPSLQDIAYDNRVATCDASKAVLKKHTVNGNAGVAQFNLKNLDPEYAPKGMTNKSELIATGDGVKLLSVQSLGMTEEDQAAA